MTDKRSIDFHDLCKEITESLSEMSGKNLAHIANQILSDKVNYVGDSMFDVEMKEPVKISDFTQMPSRSVNLQRD